MANDSKLGDSDLDTCMKIQFKSPNPQPYGIDYDGDLHLRSPIIAIRGGLQLGINIACPTVQDGTNLFLDLLIWGIPI